MKVRDAADRCLRRLQALEADGCIVVAFSGGPDSTALLHSLSDAASRYRLRIHAAHLDHGIDTDSGNRSLHASAIAQGIGVGITADYRSARDARRGGESLEAAARRIRYDFLEETANRLGADWIATAHHADDQRETVLLRLLFGSGLAGLAAIPASRGPIIRPFLDVERSAIERYISAHGLEPVEDPSNTDLEIPRNLVRHRLLPLLRSADEQIDDRLSSLSRTARAAVSRLDQRLYQALRPEIVGRSAGFRRASFETLQPNLQLYAVGALCRTIGATPPTRKALSELARQIGNGSRLGCDLGSGWHLEDQDGVLLLHRPETRSEPFAYTLKVPGEIRLPELSLVFRLAERPVESWMFRGSRWRAGMSLSLAAGDEVTIRNRRPGDRLRPLGCDYERRLKEILIDKKMPLEERDRIPLLCVGEKIVWVPGVTIDEEARLREAERAWVAEIEDVRRPRNE